MKEKIINWLIKVLRPDTNNISDGYHTFGQLYEHRIELWMIVTKCASTWGFERWKTHRHSDGSQMKGWFLLGMFSEKGHQITYHLPNKYWKRLSWIPTLKKAPEFDGHSSDDVLKRLKKL